MKRNIVIAAVTAAVLAGGGTVTALAVAGDDDRDDRATGTTSAADHRDDDRRGDDRRGGGDDERREDDGVDDRHGDGGDRSEAAGRVTFGAADAVAAALRHTPGTAVSVELDHDGHDGHDDDKGGGDDGRDARDDDRDDRRDDDRGGRDDDRDDRRGEGRDDDRGGRPAWEVDVLSGDGSWRTLWVDPAPGAVAGLRADDADGHDAAEARAALKGARVSAAEAARAVAGRGTVTSVDLDDDRDAAWKVETRDSRGEDEWRVDLRGGRVTSDRSDDD